MKPLLTCIASLVVLFTYSQNSQADERRNQVENNLAPEIVYGDSLPHLNLEKQMAAYGIKGVSVVVIKDYKIDWAKGYGWADVEEKRPVTVNTRFQAASISKSLNSMGLLKLVEQKKIALDDDINKYLKTWKFPYDSLSHNKKITLQNLLSHTAGLSVHGFRGYEYDDTIPTITQILDGKKPANSPAIRSLFEPSQKFQYSGGGTTITQLLVTDITGMRYEDYMKRNVLDPIGMSNSFFNQPPPTGTPELATAYYSNGKAVKGKYHIYPEQAAAGLWTTPTDLAKYIIESQLEYEGKSSKVLSPAMMRTRMTPYIDNSAALGVFIFEKNGVKWFNHNGGNEAFLCNSFGSLQGGNGVVVMVNSDRFDIIPEISNSVATVYGWKGFYTPVYKKIFTIARDSLQAYMGKYLLVKDTLSISLCDDKLCMRQNGMPARGLNLIFSTTTEASMREVPGASINFVFNNEGKVDELIVNEGGNKTICKRIKE
jgi:CubicO group peptidase (beta-lactamase class C family)